MINKLFYFFTFVLFTVSLSSCKKEEGSSNIYDKAYPVVITAKSLGFETDQVPESYLKGESIGVSMLENGTDNNVTPYTNIRYISDGIGFYFNAANNDSIIYLPSTGESMDLATYFPKVSGIKTDVAIDLTTNQEFGAKLQFGRINGLNKENRKAELKMKNALSLISMDIDPSAFAGVTDIEINATIQETPIKGSMNIYNGKFTATEFGSLTMASGSSLSRANNTVKFYTLVFPVIINNQGNEENTDNNIQADNITILIQITQTNDAGETEIKEIPVNLSNHISTIESATNTNFSITINENGEVEDIKVTNSNFTIDDWINNGGGIEVDGNESIK